MRLLKVGCRASWCWMLCTSVVGCLSEIFILLFKSKHSNAMENIKLCLHFLFHPNGTFLLFLLYMALCACSSRSGSNSSSQCSLHRSVMYHPPGNTARHLVLLPIREVVFVLLLCWTLNKKTKTGSSLCAMSHDFARTKEGKPHIWVMKCGISQQMINPKRCSLNLCSKARNGLEVDDGGSQADSLKFKWLV